MNWYLQAAASVQQDIIEQALAHQLTLTKPPGALGALEDVAVKLAGLQGVKNPQLERIYISVFAGDHGIAQQGVSAFPQAVTTEMVKNFASGGAAISVLARQLKAQFEVVNLGTVFAVEAHPHIIDARIAAGTQDFSQQSAMDDTQLQLALSAGCAAAERAQQHHSQLFIGGEMGIGNTSSASALAAARLNLPARQLVGMGTGISAAQLPLKVKLIDEALALHVSREPLEQLQALGGFEIVGLVGAYIRCAQLGIPVLVDGFISSVAALMAVAINDSLAPWLLFSHESAEPGHQKVLAALAAQPLLNLGMRLGEGSGAALVVSLLQSALALHNEMATFAEANVSEKEG
ncbi:MAG: nicotinate-nucleotide--dimethylbenzimidazole phosphoribosyltransferase [Bermanella sp.]